MLHSYCTPCSSAIIEYILANNIPPTVFYRNLNIYKRGEIRSNPFCNRLKS
ncbi:epoxyqueuosine reductase QueH [Bacteroides stercoris]|uniref:epoxyqueuosine reductase QueH n=1 Tax=Bacteroides stercoris TaxID=46506 RepID=UPI00189D873C|nr:epoxyqueuosine reductase QueH [Bacteroides stercoris]